MTQKFSHQIYYVVELLVLLGGFFSVFLLSSNFHLQELTLGIILFFYTLIGIFHHKLHHTLRGKIVIEYVIISILIYACFVFLNIGKI